MKQNTAELIYSLYHIASSKIPDCDFQPDDGIFSLCRIHRLDTLLYRLIEATISPDNISIYREQKKRADRQILRYSYQKAASQELSCALCENHIPHLFFKGLSTASLYASEEMRYMTDIDVYIPGHNENTQDFKNACNVILSLGFVEREHSDKHIVFFRPPCIAVELHSTLVPDRTVTRFDTYWNDIDKRIIDNGDYVLYLSHEDEYLYMLTHTAVHMLQNGGIGIRNILDIRLFRDKYGSSVDLDYISDELKKCGADAFEKNILRLVSVWFDREKSDELTDKMSDFILSSGLRGSKANFAAVRRAEAGGGASYYRSLLFPSYRELHGKIAWLDRRPFLLPAAWFYRAYKALGQKRSSPPPSCNGIEELFNDFGMFEMRRKK